MGEENEMESARDSFTVGTAGTGGCVKVYFGESDAEAKITKAILLYKKFVENERIKKELMR